MWVVKIAVSLGLCWLLLSRVDTERLWLTARTASPLWLGLALALYLLHLLINTWRWQLLLAAQHAPRPFSFLTRSYLVATFFNNFLPSNIGGDVVRIRDTAPAAGSKTIATTIVLIDRGIGLLGLVFVAALGATLAARASTAVGPVGPGMLWLGLGVGLAGTGAAIAFPELPQFLLGPLRMIHQTWVAERLNRLTTTLTKFRTALAALGLCFAGAIVVQLVLVAFYAAVARGLSIPVSFAHLAVLVPISFVVQMVPVSLNGLGVREAIFGLYFSRLNLPLESAIALSLLGAALILVFSVSGAVAYLAGGSRPTSPD
jgi:uncharacterized membrane protein YbhN (UPF0104 family)